MTPLTEILGHAQTEHVLLAVCLSIVGLSGVALWLLGRPTSWLSQRVDRAVQLPAQAETLR